MTAYGTVSTSNGHTSLCFERCIRHPVERVWRFISQPEHTVAWLAEAEIEPVEGGKVLLRWLNTDDEGNQAVACGTVTAYRPPHVLELDTDIHGRLRWELEGDGSGCLLVFTAIGDYGDHVAKALAGWHVHLDFLEEALEGRPVDWPNWPRHRWDVVHGLYLSKQP